MTIHNQFTGNPIVFSQTITSHPKGIFASNTLTLLETLTVSLKSFAANNLIVLNGVATVDKSIINARASNTLIISGRLNKVKDLSVITTFFPYHLPPPRLVKYQNVQQTLNFVQVLDGGFNKPGLNFFAINQQADFTVTFIPSISQPFVINSSARVYKISCNFYGVVLPVLNDEFTPIPSIC